MLPLTEPRNPKSLCATCEYLALNRDEYMHCVMRDLYICRGYRKCKDYLCNPDKIPYKNGDYIIYEYPTGTNAFATQKGIIREIKSKNHLPGVILIEKLPRRSNIGYLDAATTADMLSHYLWRAYYAAQYKDEAKAEHSIDEARLNQYILKNKLAQLPPSTSFPANMIPENEQ